MKHHETTSDTELDKLLAINELCDAFESAWKSGTRPSISEFLGRLRQDWQSDLFAELLGLDVDYRRRRGEDPTPEQYEQFAAFGDSISQTVVGPSDDSTDPAGNSDDGRDVTSGGSGDGVVIPGYTSRKRLGSGGCGVVFQALHEATGRTVALKLIRPEFLVGSSPTGSTLLERFGREVKAAAAVEHENIVRLYDVGQVAGQPFYTMEFIDGANLVELAREKPLEARSAARYIEQAARAVHAAHEQGIVHRDLKPHNVLVAEKDDRACVTDFGLAKLGGDVGATATGEVFGSPAYMSPEQAADTSKVDARTDVYSLGATLYFTLTGRPPFQAATSVATLSQLLHNAAIGVSTINPDVDRDLETITMKCLEKSPDARYGSARELAEDLGRFRRGEPILARPIGPFARSVRWCRRNPLAASLAGATALILVVASCVSSAFALESRQQASLARDLYQESQKSERRAIENAEEAEQERRKAEASAKVADRQRLRALDAKEEADAARTAAEDAQKKTAQYNELARKSILNQLEHYLRSCRTAGAVSVAPDNETALVILQRLGGADSVVMNTRIAEAVDTLRKRLEVTNNVLGSTPVDERQSLEVNKAAMQLAQASRVSWEEACNRAFGSSRRISRGKPRSAPPGQISVKSIEQTLIVDAIYRRIVAATQSLAQNSDHQQAEPQRKAFWSLYFGEMVFVESNAVRQAMTEFGRELARWSVGTPHDELQLARIAQKIAVACETASTPQQ